MPKIVFFLNVIAIILVGLFVNSCEKSPNPKSPVQSRLDAGETPYQIYLSDDSLLDSLNGKSYLGGMIFYLNTSDGSGLIASTTDQSAGTKWGCDGFDIPDLPNVTECCPASGPGSEVGNGASNTDTFISACGEVGSAARFAALYEENGFEDWFLPSVHELQFMYSNLYRNGFGNFDASHYWSSTEGASATAWRLNFGDGLQNFQAKPDMSRVRSVRAF
ncbi:MAG: DUF1566 domain-containing protein [Bacteroidota bacterium]